ncbi:retinoblastoma-like protein 1 [Paragonimus westermani]|uniref:Retinoblastoma-like protein 1 n=1 Tax=Paragonimus westermani TaxID=34504 RepID=A0A5J4NG03_9TREM|nr:retinoblastoma-like protein 1 [Paragonimus westermani]
MILLLNANKTMDLSVTWQTLLAGRSKEPTEALIDLIESHCSSSPLISMQSIVDGLIAAFQQAYVSSVDLAPDRVEDTPGTGGASLAVSAAQQRLHLGCTLYYLALENILVDEVRKMEKRLDVSSTVGSETGAPVTRRFKPDLTGLLTQELFHRSLFACCMELVLISCDSPDHHFPWILIALDLDAFHCFKVIEVVIRNVDFPRDVVKYMHQVTGLILDSYAWRTKSPLWTALKAAGRAPTIEEVIAPDKLEQNHSSGGISIRSDAVTTDVRKMGVSASGLIIKSGALKQPRLLASTNTSVSTSLLRTRSTDLNTNALPRHLMLASGGVEDESAQAAAQLLASGEEDMDPSASTNLLNVPMEEVHLTGADGTNNKSLLEHTATVDMPTDSGQSLWSAATNALLNYYPARHDSLAIFFRQFYVMASLRLRDLCERLSLQRDLMTKVWTCLEQAVVHETGLFRDRCLDQILLSCLYGVCKVVLYRPLSFLDIIQVYRMQPQSHRDVYRSVLINHVTYGRTNGEERGNISRFYNMVFLNKMKDYVRKASSSSYASRSGVGAVSCSEWAGQPALAPMPIHPNTTKATSATNPTGNASSGPVASQPGSEVPQARRLASNRNIFISPVKQQVNLSPKRVVFTIGRSSGKDLQDVNLMISSAERRASMANLTMGLKRPGGGTTTGYVSNSPGFTISPATSGAPRTVTLMGPGAFASKRIDFDM